MKTYCIYSLNDSRFPHDVRYIGKATGDGLSRLRQHCRDNKKHTPKSNWIREVDSSGSMVEMRVIKSGIECEKDAYRIEGEEIRKAISLGAFLTNACCRNEFSETKPRKSIVSSINNRGSAKAIACIYAVCDEILFRSGFSPIEKSYEFSKKAYGVARGFAQSLDRLSVRKGCISKVDRMTSAAIRCSEIKFVGYTGYQISKFRNILSETMIRRRFDKIIEGEKVSPFDLSAMVAMFDHKGLCVFGEDMVRNLTGWGQRYISMRFDSLKCEIILVDGDFESGRGSRVMMLGRSKDHGYFLYPASLFRRTFPWLKEGWPNIFEPTIDSEDRISYFRN